MELARRFSICGFVICWMILSLMCAGCSSKTDQAEQEGQMSPSQTASEQQAQASLKEQVKRLEQENEELKRALAVSLEELGQLKLENDKLKRAVAGPVPFAEGMKQLTQGVEKPKTSPAKTVDVEQQRKTNAKTDAMVAKFESAGSTEQKLTYLRSLVELSSEQDSSVIGVVQRALTDPDPAVGRAAVELLANYDNPEVLPAVGQALTVADKDVRMRALVPLHSVSSAEVGGLLAQALSDTSEEVRSAALGVTGERSDDIQLSVLKEGITSPYEDVKYASASILESRSDRGAVDVLLEGLKDENPNFRAEVGAIIGSLVDKEFTTYDEAQAWWAQNRNKYDDELSRIEPN